MQSRDQQLRPDILAEQRKGKSLSNSNRSHWPKAAMSRGKKTQSENNSPSSRQDANAVACDIVDLFSENSNTSHAALEERTTCSRISSSTEFEEEMDAYSSCKDCAECRKESAAKMRETGDLMSSGQTDEEESAERYNYYEGDEEETASTSNAATAAAAASTMGHKSAPILVDLTSEESKAAWKQTILKRFSDELERSELLEPRIMIADSSSRSQRSTGGSLATALRDRGPCVIPVQPNRSLPIRPAPPTPTRPASIVTSRKTHSPILKLSKLVSSNVAEFGQSDKSRGDALTNDLNESAFERQDGKTDGMMLASQLVNRADYILPDVTNVARVKSNLQPITQEVNGVKRKNSEDRDKEYEKDITKDGGKKRRKSHEVDPSRTRCDEQRVEHILKEYSKTPSGNLADKGERRVQRMALGLWDDKRRSSSVVVSTTQPEAERTKEICNKVVPPLRLKKVVREASSSDEYRNVEINTKSGNDLKLKYRVVTGVTPRPESPSGYAVSSWSSMSVEKEETDERDKSLFGRFLPKSDGYKIKYRRNRLRMKLRELRGKALKLSREMATVRGNDTDTSSHCSTRLRQMMNCYEKQIENVSKLLCKLSASISPNDSAAADREKKLEVAVAAAAERAAERKTAARSDSDSGEQTIANDRISKSSTNAVSSSPSPEPPKLSPRSPVDYDKGKSPNEVRNSPPVLPRVYIAIQPTTFQYLKKNLASADTWKGEDSSSSSSFEKGVKLPNGTDPTTTIRNDVTDELHLAVSPVSSLEFESAEGSGTTEWNAEEASPKLKDSEIEKKISEDSKAFDADVEERSNARTSMSRDSDSFLNAAMSIEMDGSDVKETKEPPVPVLGHLEDEVVTRSVSAANEKVILSEKQETGRSRSNEALPSSSSILEPSGGKTAEYGTYEQENRINVEERTNTVANTVTGIQEAPAVIERSRVSTASSVTNILQLSNYYGSPVARNNILAGVIQHPRSVQKVTSTVSQSMALDPTIPLPYAQSGSVSSSNQQCVVLPNSCNGEVVRENTVQRNDGNRIMTEQFPTLGNWVARMSKKQAKSKSKLQSRVTLPTASTTEVVRIPGLETQKIRAAMPGNVTRNNIVNVAPQWNTERWQRQQHQQQQQHQQRQQQLYAAASSATPTVRPGICPPISVAQFYPSNYTIDPYVSSAAAFGYHSATMCPYGDYSYHSRLHATVPPISGYQLPLQDPHAPSLRQMQHLDKRFPHLQDTATRHFAADLLKYPTTLSASGTYQHAASSLDFDRLRTATAAAQNSAAGAPTACLPSLLLPPPPPPLSAAAQQTLARAAPLATYSSSNDQCGRNRMIPDVVAAAAAAAVVAAASFGRQRDPLPAYARPDTAEMVGAGGISGIIDNETTQLMTANRTTANRERSLPEQSGAISRVNVDPRLNNGGYHQLQNLILDRLPYVKTDDAYPQSTAVYCDNAQEVAASTVSSSTYTSKTPILTSGVLASKKIESRKENRNCDTPHLGKVNRTMETTSNLECSNCGLIGSMFKCLGCEAAFYCDERCQTRHWSIHVEKCPKRMPKLKKLV